VRIERFNSVFKIEFCSSYALVKERARLASGKLTWS